MSDQPSDSARQEIDLDVYPDALLTLSLEGAVTSWNAGAERTFGFTADEAVGRLLAELIVPPEALDDLRSRDQEALASGQILYECVRRRKDGSVVHVDSHVRLVRGSGGDARCFAVSMRDITWRRFLREARALEEKFRGLLEASPDAMLITAADGRIVLANSEAEALFGYDRQELLGQPVEVLIPERFQERHPQHRAGYAAHPRRRPMGAGFELYGRRRDGTEIPVEISLSPLDSGHGPLIAAAIRDISERRKVEAKFRGLLEAAPDAMVIVSRDGRIALVNGQAEQLFGYRREELLGQSIELLVPGRFHKIHPVHRAQYSHDPHPRPMGQGLELHARRKDGSEVAVEISLSPLETEDGPLVTAAIRDITERKRAEELRRQADERATRQAQEASRLKSEFLANMSHELRTPLNAILGFAELMHDEKVGPVSPDHKEFLGDILASARHLLQLINDVLDLAKVEAGRMELHPEPVHPASLVGEVRNNLRSLAASRHIYVSEEIDPAVGDVVIDPAKLKQVLYNFLSNALKFTPESGRVTVRLSPTGPDDFRLEVEDTGIGIKPEDLGRLFVEFQQLDSSAAKKHQGTGLGLALTRRIVEAQGGHVGVRSRIGEGSLFFAVLPRRSALGAEERLGTLAEGAGPSVLVVDDDAKDRAWLARTLVEAGYNVDTAATGGEAIARCRERAFDAITLDLLLPDMTGWEILRTIRGDSLNRDAAVVVVTVMKENEVRGFAVQDFLTKPVHPEELLAAVKRVVESGRSEQPVLVVDDDPATLRLARSALEPAGFRPVCASDGATALRLAAAEPPSVVILDLLMPEMDGFEFLDRFRHTPEGHGAAVIVWTVADLTASERKRLAPSVEAVVRKGDGGTAGLLEELQRHAATRQAQAREAERNQRGEQ